MALTPTRRTYPQLGSQSTVDDADLFATYRGVGPLKKLLASVLKTYVLTNSGAASFILSFANAVSRTLLQRFESQPANLLDFYAVSDGANYTPALNRACAAKFAVYVPEGTYPLLDKVSMAAAGNFIFGDGVAKSVFTVTSSTFNMSATAVIECPSTADENHAGLHDIGVVCTQPSTSTRASFNQYPYIFKARDVARLMIGNIRIDGGYNGLDLRDNTGGLMGGRWELGCINESITAGGATGGSAALDFWHVDTIHVWPFGFQDATRLVAWQDGSTIAARLGRIDGLDIKTFSMFTARVITEATSGVGPFGNITTLQLDGRYSRLEHAAGKLSVGAGYSTSDLNGDYAIKLTNALGQIDIGSFFASGSGGGSQALFDAGPGLMSVGAATFQISSTYPAASVDGGQLSIATAQLPGLTNVTRTIAAFLQTSGSMSLGNIQFSEIGAGSGPGVVFTTDNTANYVNPGVMGGWVLTLPTVPSGEFLGSYGQPKFRTIAAADPLLLNADDDVVVVTGNADFGSIRVTRPGHRVTLLFTGSPILSNNPGVNEFQGQDAIIASPGLALTLTMNATNWEETARANTNSSLGWAQTTPTPTSGSGSFTTVSSVLRSRRTAYGNAEFSLVVTITNAGTASGQCLVTLPFAPQTRMTFAGSDQAGPYSLAAFVDAGSTTLNILKFDGTSPCITGAVLSINGTYEIDT
jgi:hypothetical protein